MSRLGNRFGLRQVLLLYIALDYHGQHLIRQERSLSIAEKSATTFEELLLHMMSPNAAALRVRIEAAFSMMKQHFREVDAVRQ